MAELKVGIVGCGRMGTERARCSEASGARIAAVFDIDQARSSNFARRYGAANLSRGEDLFCQNLSAVFVCTAPGRRGPVEMGCIESALPVYVEKPIGVSLDQCKGLLSSLRRKPVLNGVGYMNRYRRSVLLAKEVLQGAEVIGFSAHWVCKRYGVPWWEIERDSGGPHNEQATHLFDLCRFLIGEIETVQSAFRGTSQVSSSIECRGGILGNAFYSCDGKEKDIGVRIFTRSGSLVLSGWNFRLTENSVDGRLAEDAGEDVFQVETRTFLDAVESERRDLLKSDFFDAARTQAVMDAVRHSGESNQRARVESEESGPGV